MKNSNFILLAMFFTFFANIVLAVTYGAYSPTQALFSGSFIYTQNGKEVEVSEVTTIMDLPEFKANFCKRFVDCKIIGEIDMFVRRIQPEGYQENQEQMVGVEDNTECFGEDNRYCPRDYLNAWKGWGKDN